MTRSKFHFFLAMLLSAFMVVTVQAQDEKKQDEKKQEEKKQDSAEDKQKEPTTFAEIRAAMSKDQQIALKDYRQAERGSKEQRAALDRYYGAGDKHVDLITSLVKKDPTDRVGVSMLNQLANMTRNPMVQAKLADTMMEVAKADPKSDTAFQMLVMLMTGPVKPMVQAQARDLLMKTFGESEKMGQFAMSMVRGRSSKLKVEMLRDILKTSKLDAVKGPATYALGQLLRQRKDTEAEGIELIKSIPKKYAEVTVNGRNLAKTVEGEIFELTRLQIGMEVPDIVGEDVDGVEFKLSDYRGKVVVIDFWGDW